MKKGGEKQMQNQFEAPELTLIGEASDVVLGVINGDEDHLGDAASDFEFLQD
jgi:hypothetical protein